MADHTDDRPLERAAEKELNSLSFLFADNLEIVANPSNKNMKFDLNSIKIWTASWHFPINSPKCKQDMMSKSEHQAKGLNFADSMGDWFDVRDLRKLKFFQARQPKIFRALRQPTSKTKSEILVSLSRVHVRPHIDKCVRAYAKRFVSDEKVLEVV